MIAFNAEDFLDNILILTLFIIWMCRRMYVFSSPNPKSQVSFWLHLEYVVRLSVQYIGEQFCNVWRGWSKLKSLGQILANLRLDAHTMYVFSSPNPKSQVSFWLHLEYVVRLSSLNFYKKIFFSENTGPI
jgi:hypothetical protein